MSFTQKIKNHSFISLDDVGEIVRACESLDAPKFKV